ncbi:MAG TPA: PLP-dependent aminotransferase family protein [Rhizomicrobium sp.]|nr:PLP-dependent aminotransferase family protein [Rhizomicrobium sp.]
MSNDSTSEGAVARALESHEIDDELGDEGLPLGIFPLAIANIAIDARSPLPLHEQICQAVRTAIWTRELPPRTLLPTTRELARHLGVARNTVVFAYTRLSAEGLCISKRRRGTRVADDLPAQAVYGDVGGDSEASECEFVSLRTAFHTLHALQTRVDRTAGGTPFVLSASDPVQYPRTKLGRRLADKFLGAPPPAGFTTSNVCDRFQTSVAAYLRQARGVVCAPSQVIAVSGLEAALDLTVRVLVDPGDSILVEDPSMDIVHSAFHAARAYVRPISIDAFGANPKTGEGPPARLLFVSPSVNFPLGTSMSQARRLEVLEAARAQNAILFENDMCFELRYCGASLRSIQGQDRDGRVIYYGGFSEILGNSVRIGYLVVPKTLRDAFVEIGRRTSSTPAFQMQDALADFIEEHEFSGHARSVRSLYATRLETVKRACKDHLPQFIASEPLGGLHVVLYHQRGRDVSAICETAAAEGIPVRPLSRYYLQKPVEDGLVFGFGVVPERSIYPIIKRLGELCAEGTHAERVLAQ